MPLTYFHLYSHNWYNNTIDKLVQLLWAFKKPRWITDFESSRDRAEYLTKLILFWVPGTRFLTAEFVVRGYRRQATVVETPMMSHFNKAALLKRPTVSASASRAAMADGAREDATTRDLREATEVSGTGLARTVKGRKAVSRKTRNVIVDVVFC